MGKKRANPYKSGTSYGNIFDVLRKANQKGVTRSSLIETGHAPSDVTVILSPRAEDSVREGADCRGNASAAGHLYYVDKRKKQGEEALFVLRWRKTEMENKTYPRKKQPKVAQQTTKSVAKDETAPAETA